MIELRMVVLEGAMDTAAEALGKRTVVDEEAILGRAMEGLVLGMEGGCGDDEVDVRVVLDLPTPSVEHAGEAELGPAGLGGADVLEGGGALAQEERIEDLGMAQTERTEFLRQGEGDHEVGHRQQAGFLFGGPDLLVECAALRAGAMVTTVIGVVFGVAAVTLIEPPAEDGRAARENAPHGPVMVGVELVSVSVDVVFPMLTEEFCEMQGHGGGGGWRRLVLAVC